MKKQVRASKAAEILGVSVQTVRNWTKEGRLDYTLSAAGQRLYNVEYLHSIINPEIKTKQNVFYVRSSTKNDVCQNTQLEKLTKAYGNPDKVFKDIASGLNENRKGLNALLDFCINNPSVVYVCNKDRLSRFGFTYLEKLLKAYNSDLVVLDDDTTKEPHQVLLQDFMSLLASFSGKFYRLRGWEQQKRFLEDVSVELNSREQNL